jgi:pimeloyl-ACP methyl ester carboxylesterase
MEGRTFVLVAGAWRGGWAWRQVNELLQRRGHRVFTPTLTGVADRSHLLAPGIGLETHVSDVVNLLKWEGLHNVVLCGHSYAGFVALGVAERAPGAIESLVFLDAFVPEDGQALVDLASPAAGEAIRAAAMRGEISVSPIPAAAFAGDPKHTAWVDAMCTPHPINCFLDPIKLTGMRERVARKVYVRAMGYRGASFETPHARAKADPAWRVAELPCGHDVMIDMPEQLAEILESA